MHSVPFSCPLPWETPITELYGQGLGIALGVRTELGIAGGKDKGDLDPLAVRPLPVQEAVLAGPAGMEVALEADKRGGFLSEGHDTVSRYTVGHHGVDQVERKATRAETSRRLAKEAASLAARFQER